MQLFRNIFPVPLKSEKPFTYYSIQEENVIQIVLLFHDSSKLQQPGGKVIYDLSSKLQPSYQTPMVTKSQFGCSHL